MEFLSRLPRPLQVLLAAVGLLFTWAGAITFWPDLKMLLDELQKLLPGVWLLVVGFVSLFFGFAPSIGQAKWKSRSIQRPRYAADQRPRGSDFADHRVEM